MLEAFVYENHKGLIFDGLPLGVYLQTNELRDYTWEYETINDRISRFYRALKQRKLPLVICCTTVAEAAEVKNRLLDFADTDIEAMRPGKIRIGEWYTTGYITSSKKKDYRLTGRYCTIELLLTSAEPSWYREEVHVFGGDSDINPQVIADYGDFVMSEYPYDYGNFDYSVSHNSRHIRCNDIRRSAFKLRIFGGIDYPTIAIASHVHRLNGTVKPREIVEIDSRNKTIILTTEFGEKVNWFANRDRDNYIFEPIPTGIVSVSYNGRFRFELTVIEERSEPRWI